MPQFHSAYSPKDRHQLTFTGPGRTKQSFKAECDINNILARFRKTGVLDFTTRHQAQYADVTGADFTTAMQTVAAANSLFYAMPAHLRDRFKNSPAEFLAFVQNDDNKAEAQKLGLLKPETPAAAAPAAPQAAAPAAPVPPQASTA